MAFVPYVLKKDSEFSAVNSSDQMTLSSGTSVQYERTETTAHIVHIARYWQDGQWWYHVQRLPNLPINPSKGSSNAARATHQAATAIAAREQRADGNEGLARRQEAIVRVYQGRVFQVNYYIPETLNGQVKNPSSVFRRYGFRLDGSNWVFPEKGLHSPAVRAVLAEWDRFNEESDQRTDNTETDITGNDIRHKVSYWEIEYTKDQLAKMRAMSIDQLARTLRDCHRSLIESIDKAEKDLATAFEATEDEAACSKAVNYRNSRLRTAIKEACERFEMAIRGAEMFDETGSLDALFSATRAALKTSSITINALLESQGVKTVTIPAVIG